MTKNSWGSSSCQINTATGNNIKWYYFTILESLLWHPCSVDLCRYYMENNAFLWYKTDNKLNVCVMFQKLVCTHVGRESGACPVSTSTARSELFCSISVQHPRLEAGSGQDAHQAWGWWWHCTILQTTGPKGILFLIQVSEKFNTGLYVSDKPLCES